MLAWLALLAAMPELVKSSKMANVANALKSKQSVSSSKWSWPGGPIFSMRWQFLERIHHMNEETCVNCGAYPEGNIEEANVCMLCGGTLCEQCYDASSYCKRCIQASNAWLASMVEESDEPALRECPYCHQLHQAEHIERCPLKPVPHIPIVHFADGEEWIDTTEE